MDLLSAVLREVRFASAAYRWLDLRAPFRLDFDQPHLRGVHIVARGGCELTFPDGTVQPLHEGDLVILPRGDTHSLRSPGAPAAAAGLMEPVRNCRSRGPGGGGGRPATPRGR